MADMIGDPQRNPQPPEIPSSPPLPQREPTQFADRPLQGELQTSYPTPGTTRHPPEQPVPAGWYVDPLNATQDRWWDGAGWGTAYQAHLAGGPPQPYQQAFTQNALVVPARAGGLGVAAMVIGILAFVIVWAPLFIGFFMGGTGAVLALILGIIGANQPARSKGPAITGIVLGGIVLVLLFFGVGIIL